MAKEVKQVIKLQIMGGQATPAPPVGPALGQAGVNIQQFCQAFNAKTQNRKGEVVPTIITVYKDRSFDFVLKTPPATYLIKKALGIEKGSGEPNKLKVGKITRKQLEEIAAKKMPDLNTNDINEAVKIIAGSCRSMGVEVEL